MTDEQYTRVPSGNPSSSGSLPRAATSPSSSGSLPRSTNPSSSGSLPRTYNQEYQPYGSRNNSNAAYVRQPRHHTTMPAVDDFRVEPDVDPAVAHDSSFTFNNRVPIQAQSRSYRRARSEQAKLSQSNKYGQYLSVPKGSREIFASRERQSAQRKAIIGIIVAAIIVILLVVLWPK